MTLLAGSTRLALFAGALAATAPSGATAGDARCPLGFTYTGETKDAYICDRILKMPGPQLLVGEVEKASVALAAQLQRLIDDLAKAREGRPPPETRRTVHEGVILGIANTPYDAVKFGQEQTSPFSKRPYRDEVKQGEAMVIAFGTEGMARELRRGLADNMRYGAYSLSSEVARQVLPSLEGTHFKRLIAHSNGATTSEALIRSRIITVEELNIVGGDRSMANFAGYQQMISSGLVKRVKVWINPGDPVPQISSTAFSWPARNVALALKQRIFGPNMGGDAVPEIYVLSAPKVVGQEFGLAAHTLSTAYYPFMPERYERLKP